MATSSVEALVELDAPLHLNIELTANCNSRCQFCFSAKRSRSVESEPSLELLKRILGRVRTADVFRITFFGGEPTISPHLRPLIPYAYDLGFFLGVISNGFLINADLVKLFVQFEVSVGISIHSHDPGINDEITGIKGAFLKTHAALRLLREHNIDTTCNFTLTRKNYSTFGDFVEYMHGLYPNVSLFVANRLIPSGRAADDANSWLTTNELNDVGRQMSRLVESGFSARVSFGDAIPFCVLDPKYHEFNNLCSIGTTFGLVTPHGDVKMCGASDQSFGNILETPLREIWASEPLREYRSLQWLPESCISCSFLKNCLAGCRYSDPATNSYAYGPDFYLRQGQ